MKIENLLEITLLDQTYHETLTWAQHGDLYSRARVIGHLLPQWVSMSQPLNSLLIQDLENGGL